MIRAALFAFACCLPVSACTQFPELDASVPDAAENAAYPELVPVESLLGPDRFDPAENDETADRIENRTRSLQARAERLRQRNADGN